MSFRCRIRARSRKEIECEASNATEENNLRSYDKQSVTDLQKVKKIEHPQNEIENQLLIDINDIVRRWRELFHELLKKPQYHNKNIQFIKYQNNWKILKK